MIPAKRITFEGSQGASLAARLDAPAGAILGYALFAHCFTCSKDVLAASRIAAELARQGIAVLRFDFTGLGSSGGDFANTNFSSNVADLVRAADYLRREHQAPSLLVGHSLGGAAVLMAAAEILETKAIATIGAPADVSHVLRNLGSDLERTESEGVADVSVAGRHFQIRRDFIEDARAQDLRSTVAGLRQPLLLLHAPTDMVVGIENARHIFDAARHPKSFMALDGADHLLTEPADAIFAAELIGRWAARYLSPSEPAAVVEAKDVRVTESGLGRFQQLVSAGAHRFLADEPSDVGGNGSGPTPYDLLSAALGACTAMTLRMYAERKSLTLGRISVAVNHSKTHASDCADCVGGRSAEFSLFERTISIMPEPPAEVMDRLSNIADRCPVHRTLSTASRISTVFPRSRPAAAPDHASTTQADDSNL